MRENIRKDHIYGIRESCQRMIKVCKSSKYCEELRRMHRGKRRIACLVEQIIS